MRKHPNVCFLLVHISVSLMERQKQFRSRCSVLLLWMILERSSLHGLHMAGYKQVRLWNYLSAVRAASVGL